MTSLITTPFRMTKERVRYVHALALKRKGLSYEIYKLRLGAVGVKSSTQLKRASYARFVAGLKALPDAPGYRKAGKS